MLRFILIALLIIQPLYATETNEEISPNEDNQEIRLNEDSETVEKEDYQGIFKIGNPYKINGIKYNPRINNNYNKTGIASWYGSDFHNKKTANGETYDQFEYTAAHPTLPLPSMVEVTNLENGNKLIVKINDRGPFAHDRIIDLSFQSAIELDFINKGTTRVRVKFLKEETDLLHQQLFGTKYL